ncbi:MAG: hypothetical protein P8049_04280 [Gemmatimonadota bacterium]
MDLSNRSAALALAGVLTMGLAACGGSADAETADYEAAKPVAETAYADEANNEIHKGDASSSASAGSPGMEADDGHVDEYEVVTFDDAGQTKVYARY